MLKFVLQYLESFVITTNSLDIKRYQVISVSLYALYNQG